MLKGAAYRDELSSGANPLYTADELVHQLKISRAKLIVAHPACYPTALSAAKSVGIPTDRIVLLGALPDSSQVPTGTHVTIDALVSEGNAVPPTYQEVRLAPGEGKTKLAFLSFSSGTTGLPKVRPCFVSSASRLY